MHLREVFTHLRQAKLKLHPKKLEFAVQEVHYLRHVLCNPDKVEAIKSYPTLCKIKQLRSFLGMIGHYGKFIWNFAVIAKPLYELTKKDFPFQWSETCNKAFNELKDKMLC